MFLDEEKMQEMDFYINLYRVMWRRITNIDTLKLKKVTDVNNKICCKTIRIGLAWIAVRHQIENRLGWQG